MCVGAGDVALTTPPAAIRVFFRVVCVGVLGQAMRCCVNNTARRQPCFLGVCVYVCWGGCCVNNTGRRRATFLTYRATFISHFNILYFQFISNRRVRSLVSCGGSDEFVRVVSAYNGVMMYTSGWAENSFSTAIFSPLDSNSEI
jgi:hypothetical protein